MAPIRLILGSVDMMMGSGPMKMIAPQGFLFFGSYRMTVFSGVPDKLERGIRKKTQKTPANRRTIPATPGPPRIVNTGMTR